MDRDRDRRPYGDRDRIETYRPSHRDSLPIRGGGPPSSNTYAGSQRHGRPRSRSPPSRRRSRSPMRDDRRESGFRPRAPPHRNFSPRRPDDRRDKREDDRRGPRYRSPARGGGFAREPPRRERSRSPVSVKRAREYSPVDRAHSPPPKRERLVSPVKQQHQSPPRRPFSPHRDKSRDSRDHRGRSRSPRRDDRPDSDAPDVHRRRSPDLQSSAPVSTSTSRRSSPPVNPNRLGVITAERTLRLATAETRSPAYISPARSPPREPRGQDRDFRHPDGPANRNGDTASFRPPSGPAGRNPMSPPSGPSAASPVSAHNRFSNNPILSAPSQPRGGRGGGFGPPRGPYGGRHRDYSGGPSPRRVSDFGNSPRGGYFPSGSAGPPTGPRASPEHNNHHNHHHMSDSGYRGGFRGGYRGGANSTSNTYPRSQRFNGPGVNGQHGPNVAINQYLADLPSIIPGGQKYPPQNPAWETKLRRLEEEAERMRGVIAEKQKTKRQGLREWNKLTADTDSARLRGEYVEENLRKLNGEDVNGPAF